VSRREVRTDSPAERQPPPSHRVDRAGYAWRSTRPLPILVFLLPLIIAYAIGSAMYLTDPTSGATETIRAERMLRQFFESAGIAGLHLPAFAIIAVLLAWQFVSRDPWRVRPSHLTLMALESFAWTLPILALVNIIGGVRPMATLAGSDVFTTMSGPQLVTIAIGAGLYEELLFRMVLITIVHLLAHDLLRIRDHPARIIAVILSAGAFALYHDAAAHDAALLAFYFIAGSLFGVVYLWRGFGIVVGAHAAYDLIALLL